MSRAFPMPNDVIDGRRIVVASVEYIADERGEVALVLLLEQEAPFFTVAHYALTDFDPTNGGLLLDTVGSSYVAGELDELGRFSNIVPAVREYEQSGGDY